MGKDLDSQVLMTTIMGVVEQVLAKMSGVVATSPPEVKEVDIDECEGRMKVLSMRDFQSSIYIAVVNYYVSQADVDRQKAKGALVLYLDSENASKLYKALGFMVPEDEDDASMLDGCGELCNLIGGGFKNELANMGFVNLVMSAPHLYKNTVMQGVKFSLEQKKKFQFTFYYWKRKAIVLEATLASIPQK